MPALSSTMTEGKISQWLKSVGDKIEVDADEAWVVALLVIVLGLTACLSQKKTQHVLLSMWEGKRTEAPMMTSVTARPTPSVKPVRPAQLDQVGVELARLHLSLIHI